MAYLDPSQFDIQNINDSVVAIGYFDNGIGVRLEQHESAWLVYSLFTEGWPEVKFEGEFVAGPPLDFDSLDDALSYMEQIQAL